MRPVNTGLQASRHRHSSIFPDRFVCRILFSPHNLAFLTSNPAFFSSTMRVFAG